MSLAEWRRVSRHDPCPVCGRADWCLLAGPEGDPEAAICPRIESGKRCGEAGWLHRLRDPDTSRTRRFLRRIVLDHGPKPDFAGLMDGYRRYAEDDRLDRLARSLGLAASSLRRFGAGWAPVAGAWAFPMWDASGGIIGIHLRKPDGAKLSVKRSKLGLFLPDAGAVPSGPGPLLFAEGLTDAAALAEMGFAVAGRPSNQAGESRAAALVRRAAGAVALAVVVADGDGPGRQGAESLAQRLTAYAPEVRVIAPPKGVKDIREWYGQGCTRQAIEQAIGAAPGRRLTVRASSMRGTSR